MADIVERLRGPAPLHWEAKEAADTITALRAENERLRAALEDIAYPNPDHGEDQLMQIARAALEEKQ